MIAALSGALPRAAFAQTDREKAAARSAADAGGDAFDQGHYAEALELFTRAEQLVHAPPHLLFMARAREKLGKLVEAHETYMKVVKEPLATSAPAAFKQAQTDAQAEIGALEARLARVTVTVRGQGSENAVLNLDGVDLPPAMLGIPFPLDPGAHVFSAHTPTANSGDAHQQLAEGEKQSLVLELHAVNASPSRNAPLLAGPSTAADAGESSARGSSKTWAIVALGAGVAASGVATYFTVSSLKSRSKAKEIYGCDRLGACTDAQKSQISKYDGDADRARNWAIALYSLGVGGIVSGVFLLTSANAGAAQHESIGLARREVRLDAGLGWIGASGRF